MGDEVWCVWQTDGPVIEFFGVFCSEEEATAACCAATHCIAPVTLGERLPPWPTPWPGARFPLASLNERHNETDAAEFLARALHALQRDKAGLPYIDHLRRVVGMCSRWDHPVAWLHDALEDTTMSATGLIEAGFSKEIVDAVIALTHRGPETYREYIDRLCENEAAKRVKLADLADNLDPARRQQVVDTHPDAIPRLDYLIGRYLEARERILTGEWPNG